MKIVTCKFCRRLFESYNQKVCPECMQKIDKDFIKVKDYLYDHKKADVDAASKDTEVDKAVILYLLKEGRLTLAGAEGDAYVLTCEVCKKPIASGRMCQACMDKLSRTMDKSIGYDRKKEAKEKDDKKPMDVKSGIKMHIRPGDKPKTSK